MARRTKAQEAGSCDAFTVGQCISINDRAPEAREESLDEAVALRVVCAHSAALGAFDRAGCGDQGVARIGSVIIPAPLPRKPCASQHLARSGVGDEAGIVLAAVSASASRR